METETPYEKRLLALANEASKAKDPTTLGVIEQMIAQIRTGHYGPLQRQFPYLLPSYRIRLGAPPTSREEDQPRDRDAAPRR
jgi:hypothetical protein